MYFNNEKEKNKLFNQLNSMFLEIEVVAIIMREY